MNTTIFQFPDYSNIFFDYLFDIDKTILSRKRIRYSMILFVFAGELIIEYDDRKISVKKGEYVFLKHNTAITSCEKEGFYGAYIGFNKSFLSTFYNNQCLQKDLSNLGVFESNIIELDQTPYTQSLYISLIPYSESGLRPTNDILTIKQLEGVYCLLMTDDRFYSCLFDPYKYN